MVCLSTAQLFGWRSFCTQTCHLQLFVAFFKTLVGKRVTVELKNNLSITGVLHSVDQYMNFRLDGAAIDNAQQFPQLTAVKNLFIRGSTVRYVHMASADVDTMLLQDAARKEASQAGKQ